MAHVLLFHHALGLTSGVHSFAQHLRAAGHQVTLPDLYEGKIFETIEAGVTHAESIGMQEIIRRGVATATALPEEIVYAGFSLGSLPAQKLAQTRPGALGAILYHGGIPSAHFGCPWPGKVALQIHVTEHDKWNDLADVQQLATAAKDAELFIYPGSRHLVADPSYSDFDATIADQIKERTLNFLNRGK